ncbi:MAG: HRDC domain-containing protein, partial [Candidatus Paceibacterota bacterium]
HDRLSVHGIIVDIDEEKLCRIVDQLIDSGHLKKSEGMYPVLSITKKGVVFLMGNDLLGLPKPGNEENIAQTAAPKEDFGYNQALFEILKALRKKLADGKGVPPFVIFGNATLQEMARFFPADENSLMRITGVGSVKLKRFGKIFLKTINDFAKSNNLRPINIPAKTK